jgi:hypothetical protein
MASTDVASRRAMPDPTPRPCARRGLRVGIDASAWSQWVEDISAQPGVVERVEPVAPVDSVDPHAYAVGFASRGDPLGHLRMRDEGVAGRTQLPGWHRAASKVRRCDREPNAHSGAGDPPRPEAFGTGRLRR